MPTESVDRIGSNTVVHFDEAEVQEIGLGDTDYPQLLRAIRKPPKVLRFRGSLPPNTKIIAISGSRKPTKQAALQTAYKIGKMLAQNTDTPLSPVSPKVATKLPLKVRFPQEVTLWVSSHADSKHWDPVKENCPKKSSLPAVLSFLNILTTSQNSGITICEKTRSLRGCPKKPSSSRLASDQVHQQPQIALFSRIARLSLHHMSRRKSRGNTR